MNEKEVLLNIQYALWSSLDQYIQEHSMEENADDSLNNIPPIECKVVPIQQAIKQKGDHV